jgi:hypothetical protein
VTARARFGWATFAAFVLLNAAWLYHDLRAEPNQFHDAAYAACRYGVRQARAEASRIPFPTADLVRVSRRDDGHASVRAFYETRGGERKTWYRCELELTANKLWRVDTVMFDR